MIKRLSVVVAIAWVTPALAQQKPPAKPQKPPAGQNQPKPAKPPDDPKPEIEIEVNPDQPAQPGKPGEAPTIEIDPNDPEVKAAEPVPGEAAVSWQDVVVVMRKPFLKMNRFELMPSWGTTLNDNMIRHIMFQGQLNYWLTDVLAVGAEGQIFAHSFLEPYDLVARNYRRLPTLNKYNFGAALNFHYVPIYGKFAMLNKWIIHWEWMVTAGVGFTQTEVIPRDPALPGWKNFLITPNVGLTMRVFITSWITLDLQVRDYIFVDKFESVNRTTADVNAAMQEASGNLINNVMFFAGISFWLPTSFEYTTFR